MSQITRVNNRDQIGRIIYQTNQHYRRLADVMECPEFRQIFDIYMQDGTNAKTIIMFMKIYQAVESYSEVRLTPFQKIAIVKDVIEDAETRRIVCDGIQKWFSLQSTTLPNERNHNCIESNIPSID